MRPFKDFVDLRHFQRNIAQGDFGYIWYTVRMIETRDVTGEWHCHSRSTQYASIYSAFETHLEVSK